MTAENCGISSGIPMTLADLLHHFRSNPPRILPLPAPLLADFFFLTSQQLSVSFIWRILNHESKVWNESIVSMKVCDQRIDNLGNRQMCRVYLLSKRSLRFLSRSKLSSSFSYSKFTFSFVSLPNLCWAIQRSMCQGLSIVSCSWLYTRWTICCERWFWYLGNYNIIRSSDFLDQYIIFIFKFSLSIFCGAICSGK